MQDFMKVITTEGSKLLTELPDLTKGDKVRVLIGPFEGVEGIFVKMPKRHENRVVVQIQGVAAVVTTSLLRRDVEKI